MIWWDRWPNWPLDNLLEHFKSENERLSTRIHELNEARISRFRIPESYYAERVSKQFEKEDFEEWLDL